MLLLKVVLVRLLIFGGGVFGRDSGEDKGSVFISELEANSPGDNVPFEEDGYRDNSVSTSALDKDNLNVEQLGFSKNPFVVVNYFLVNDRMQVVDLKGASIIKLEIGNRISVVCGVSNRADVAINVTEIRVLAMPILYNNERLPYDIPHKWYGVVVEPNNEVSLLYDLLIPENRAGMQARVSLEILYRDSASQYKDVFVNRTIEFNHRDISDEVWKLAFSFCVIIGTLLIVLASWIITSRRITSRKTETSSDWTDTKRVKTGRSSRH
uniref:Signal sequence receptor subunit alpha n=1 Tax=Mucochytrium quahogii TaxID=96639 RepID=A0A7S2RDL2_9STRA|mmetsp:Transcript_14191/g.25215  ORF Transcript_14191/g.25215 Transcript_14191/m.25215 type:complete len:267 (-) Transcript_14191:2385-3185(-)